MAEGVRKIRGGQRGRKIVTRFPSLKMKRVVWGESPLELDYHCLLEFDSDVLAFKEQPFRIEYVLKGEQHFYTPDVLVLRANGQRQIIEVKMESEAVKPENQLLYSLVRSICARENYVFGLALDRDIRREPRLSNIKLLLRYERTQIGLTHRLVCDDFFSARDQSRATIRDLIEFCGRRNVESGKVYALICRGVLGVKLDEILGPNSLVWFAKHTLARRLEV